MIDSYPFPPKAKEVHIMSLTVFDESPIAVTAKLVITGRLIYQDECPDHRLVESPATA